MDKQPQTNGSLALEEKKVIVIETALRLEAEKLRAAVYCRVSSDSSDQLNSFMAQLNYYTTLIGSKETPMTPTWLGQGRQASGLCCSCAEKRCATAWSVQTI